MSDNRATDRGDRAHPQGGGSSGGKTGGSRGGREQQNERDEQRERAEAERKHTGYLAEQYGWSEAQVNVIRRAICAKATDEELEFFIATARRLGLDMFARQIWFVKRKQQIEDAWGNKQWIEVGRPETSIDGLRTIAERTGLYRGQLPHAWCGDDGQWREVWLPKKGTDGRRPAPAAARAVVFREGHRGDPTFGDGSLVSVAHFDEFCPTFGKGPDARIPAMWEKMAANQLAKCAEAAAFRRAFPLEMSGIATDVEMEHTYAATEATAATHAPPPQKPAELPPPDAELGASITEVLERVRTASKRSELDQVLEAVTALKARAPQYAKRIDEAVKPLYDAKANELRGRKP